MGIIYFLYKNNDHLLEHRKFAELMLKAVGCTELTKQVLMLLLKNINQA